MFDNPNEELKKLEEQLLAVEEKDESFEAFYSDILQEFGPESAASKPAKTSSSHKKTTHNAAHTGKAHKSGHAKKKKSNKGLIITLCLECAGIAGIVAWWLLRIL